MPIYLIERINRDTGAAKAELAEAPFLAIAFIEQENKHGSDYIYRLVGRLENGKIVSDEPDHNTTNKDQLHRFYQYIGSMAESSYTNPFASPYRDDPDMAKYVDTTSRLTSNKQSRLRKLLQNSKPTRGRRF